MNLSLSGDPSPREILLKRFSVVKERAATAGPGSQRAAAGGEVEALRIS